MAFGIRHATTLVLALASVVSIGELDCGGKVLLPFCPQTPTVACVSSNRDINTIKCNCRCLNASVQFNQGVCAPTAINASTTALSAIDAMPQQQYDDIVVNACNQVKQQFNNIIPGVLGSPCTGGIFGDYCDCNPTTGDTLLDACRQAENTCTPKQCDGTTISKTCQAVIAPIGGFDLTRCGCTIVSNCGANVGPICPVGLGQGDPPDEGIITQLVAGASTLRVEAPSSMTLTLGFTPEEGGSGQVPVGPIDASGELRTFGRPRADGSADVLFDLSLKFKDTTFSVDGNTVNLTHMIASGGMGSTQLSIGSNAIGEIPINALNLVLDFEQNGTVTRINSPTIEKVPLMIDYKAKTFKIPSLPFNTNQGVAGTISLQGTITNQAPVALVGADQTLECTSPAGASATLDGSSSFDVDSNLVTNGAVWHHGVGVGPASNVIATGLTTTVTAPLGTTPYTLSLTDAVLQTGLATTNVTVRDTTPPALTLETLPSCLAPQNHKMVLYQLGTTLKATVVDTCDPSPTVEILDVTSSQPDLGGGQGRFTPDIVHGAHAFCIRSEREGSSLSDRLYSVKVKATDASMNTTIRTVTVRVPHDQKSAKCANIDPSRIVDASDPRCTR